MNWQDVTLKQYEQLIPVMGGSYDNPMDRVAEIGKILYGVNILDEPVFRFQDYLEDMKFLNTPVDKGRLAYSYEINGRRYELTRDITEMTTAQYYDFTEMCKDVEKNIVKIMCIFLIPEGRKYNDGYSMSQVHTDMEAVRYIDATEIVNFSLRRLRNYIRSMVCFSALNILRAPGTPWKKKWTAAKELLKGWANMESSISSWLRWM